MLTRAIFMAGSSPLLVHRFARRREGPRARMLRDGEEFLRRCIFDEHAAIHHYDAVRDLAGEADFVFLRFLDIRSFASPLAMSIINLASWAGSRGRFLRGTFGITDLV